MMPVININRNLEIVNEPDKRHNPNFIFMEFLDMVSKSGFKIIEAKNKGMIKHIIASKGDKGYDFFFVIRNVSHAGWSEKPHIKRIQVQNLSIEKPELFKPKNNKTYFFFVGYYNFDNNPLFVFWDPGRYTSHKTNRSCYVFLNTLEMAYRSGYIDTVNSNRKVWAITQKNFIKFLNNYYSIIDSN